MAGGTGHHAFQSKLSTDTMPVLQVPSAEAEFLASTYPESGMGYQLFEGSLSQWTRRFFLALNGEFIIPFSSLTELRVELVRVSEAGTRNLPEISVKVTLTAEPSFVAKQLGWRLAASLLDPNIETSPRLREMVTPQDIVARELVREPRLYCRFSAFPNDRRVNRDGSFVPGTYATTYNDLSMVPSGFAAVGRYALPSTLSARFMYPIVTGASPIYVGTATPNYGQAGGGVEVMFPSGAQPSPGTPHRISRD